MTGAGAPRPRGIRRGAAILPATFTVGNLFCGFWALVLTLRHSYAEAAGLVVVAMVLDMLDGRIARLTGTTSEFGGELDSLADVISFGVAPALLVYRWAFELTMPRAGWLAAFLFVACGAIRLARFNVQRHAVDSRYFVGLPIPAAAAQVAAVVHFAPRAFETGERFLGLLALVGTISVGFLMVSTIRYRSFKSLDLRSRRSYVAILAIPLALILVGLDPQWFLLAVASAYCLSGPVVQLASLLFRKRSDPPPSPAVATGEAG